MTLCEHLETVLSQYFAGHPNVSINALANKSGIGATTIRRLISKNKNSTPAPHVVLNIVSALSNEKQLPQILNQFNGPIQDYLRDNFGKFVPEQENTHSYDVELNQVLRDSACYLIYKLAANRMGTTRTEIAQILGTTGLEKVEQLLAQQLLIEDGPILHARDKNFTLDIEIAASHLPNLVSFYRPSKVAEGRNIFYSLSESINEEGITKIKDLQREAAKKIFAILNSPFYEGEIPYFSLVLSEAFHYEQKEELLQ